MAQVAPKFERKVITEGKDIPSMIADLKQQSVIGVDTETTGFNFWEHTIIGFCFASPTTGYYLPYSQDISTPLILEAAKEILEHPNDKVFHNGKFDITFITECNLKINGKIHDTMIQAHLLDENRTSKKLKDLANQYIAEDSSDSEKVLKDYFKKNNLEHYGQIPISIIGPYACADPWFTLQLHLKFYPKIQEQFQQVYDNEMGLLLHLVDMEKRGVLIDIPYLTKFQEDCSNRLLELQPKIFETFGGKTCNLNSGDELAEILFGHLKLPVKDVSAKTGKPCLDKYTLEKLEGLHPSIELLKEYRGLQKLTSTYLNGILSRVVRGNMIHADFQQCGTATGRLSCWNPNLHNIPRGDSIRRAFLNPSKDTQFLFFDYSQIEYRMVAHYSKDAIMVEGFETGADFHTWTGMKLFNLSAEELTKEHRIKAKQINFGILYGMGKKSLAQKLGVTEPEAAIFLNDYYDTFPALRPFVSAIKQAVRQRGYIKNFIGRQRRMSAQECYKAVNALAQGSAADILKTAINKVGDYLKTKKSHMVMNIHDELIIVHYLDEPEVIKDVQRIMSDFKFRVPIVAEVEYSNTNWGEKKKFETEEE